MGVLVNHRSIRSLLFVRSWLLLSSSFEKSRVDENEFDTVEVCGSSPHGPTILFITLESLLRNPAKTSPLILHL